MIGQAPLYGSAEHPEVPWWAPVDSTNREAITLHLPPSVIEALTQAEAVLGINRSDLVAAYVVEGTVDAMTRHKRMLGDIQDHDRISGWLPSGTPQLNKVNGR